MLCRPLGRGSHTLGRGRSSGARAVCCAGRIRLFGPYGGITAVTGHMHARPDFRVLSAASTISVSGSIAPPRRGQVTRIAIWQSRCPTCGAYSILAGDGEPGQTIAFGENPFDIRPGAPKGSERSPHTTFGFRRAGCLGSRPRARLCLVGNIPRAYIQPMQMTETLFSINGAADLLERDRQTRVRAAACCRGRHQCNALLAYADDCQARAVKPQARRERVRDRTARRSKALDWTAGDVREAGRGIPSAEASPRASADGGRAGADASGIQTTYPNWPVARSQTVTVSSRPGRVDLVDDDGRGLEEAEWAASRRQRSGPDGGRLCRQYTR